MPAKWVLRMLTPAHKMKRFDIFRTLLTRFLTNPKNFLGWFITQYERWVHRFESESTIQNKQWKQSGSLLSKKFKQAASVGKVTVSIFLESKAVIIIDYLEEGKTINGKYFAPELSQVKEAIMSKGWLQVCSCSKITCPFILLRLQ